MAQKPKPVENVPSVEEDISGLGSANAPFVYFEAAPAYGIHGGVTRLTLTASRVMPRGGQVITDHVVVAHLRTNTQGVHSLKNALEKVLLMLTPTPSIKQ